MTGMAPTPGAPSWPLLGQWDLLGSRHPEWWLWGAAAAGCLVLVAVVGPGHHHGASPGMHAAAWAAMIAVTAPLTARNVRYAALRSPRDARADVAAAVVAGWALVWAGAAVVLGAVAWLLAATVGDAATTALATAGAVGWQRAPLKRRSLARCHRVVAPPLGRRRSRRASWRYGAGLGRDCVLSCWPLMTLMAVAGHNLAVVAVCGGVAWYERRRPHHDPATRGTSLAVAAVGVTAVVAAIPSLG
jgi:predicted metal-binding membrane protein